MYNGGQALWLDTSKLSADSVRMLARKYPASMLVPVVCADKSPAVIIAGEPYPTPQQLFQWKPEEQNS